ncbi:uncharacterized protein LOC131690272 [Topomyia yanbarensis]|uniref:uncharacterized protein LOC131690272 n=1 Tax=Topomyia yanbarensis TaxID=2498891 RepID=UPI00273A86CA|nr:uncharacterized protein LOC131690272 [Topomyia yanbarensis]
MGRKINFTEKPKKGPGRKSKKQKDPTFSKEFLKEKTELKKLSRKQIIRAKKREQAKIKNQESKAKTDVEDAKSKKASHNEKYTSNKEHDAQDDSFHSLPAKMDLQKSREKYAKVTEKSNSALKVEKESSSSVSKTTKDRIKDKHSRDILASDNESSTDSSEEEPRIAKLNDFLSSNDEDSGSDFGDKLEDYEQKLLLPIERAGKKLRRKKEVNDRMAEAELEDLVANKEKFEFPNSNQEAPTNLQEVHTRIKDVIGVLVDFLLNRDPNHSRAEYIDLLCKDLCVYYTYNEFLMQQLLKIFAPNQLLEFLEASEIQRPLTIRTNSLKTRRRDLAQALINRGVNLDPLGKWSKEGLVVYTSQVPLGATPEYLGGHYMIQGASSMLPVIALAPEENERILDLCAAPGGKSSHLAALMKNTGVLFSNDSNKDRLQAVVGNFHRLGIQNAIVTNIDGTKYRHVMTGFDRVLLDAPCTGSGVISKDQSVKTTKAEVDIQRCYNLQRKLILAGIDCLSASSETGGYLVYSTCSILPQENEWVIDYALRKRNVRLVSTGLDLGTEGFVNFAGQKYHPSMKLTRRFYPHTYNMDGFFVAKLQKFSDLIPSNNQESEDNEIAIDDQNTIQNLPKKIDKRDWYYKDIIEKRKKIREDPNHVLKVFEKPVKNKKMFTDVTFLPDNCDVVFRATKNKRPDPANNKFEGRKKKKLPSLSASKLIECAENNNTVKLINMKHKTTRKSLPLLGPRKVKK